MLLLVVLLGVWYGVAVGRNDYRDARKQRNVVLDHALDDRLRVVAKERGLSVNEFVVRLIEREVGYAGDDCGRGDRAGVASSGVAVGAAGGRGGGGDSVGVSAAGRSVDWDGLLEAGRRAKARYEEPVLVEPDPLDVIA